MAPKKRSPMEMAGLDGARKTAKEAAAATCRAAAAQYEALAE